MFSFQRSVDSPTHPLRRTLCALTGIAVTVVVGCSDRFDAATSIGSDLLDDLDPSLTSAAWLYHAATESLSVLDAGSYPDTARRFYPGENAARLIRHPGLHTADTVITIGTWGGSEAVGYAEFVRAAHDFPAVRTILSVELQLESSPMNDSAVWEQIGKRYYTARIDTILRKSTRHQLVPYQTDRRLSPVTFWDDGNEPVVIPLSPTLWDTLTHRVINRVQVDSTIITRSDSVVLSAKRIRDTDGRTESTRTDTFFTWRAVRSDTTFDTLSIATGPRTGGTQFADNDTIPQPRVRDTLLHTTPDSAASRHFTHVEVRTDSLLFATADTITRAGRFARVPIAESITRTPLPDSVAYDSASIEEGLYYEYYNTAGKTTIIARSGVAYSSVTDSIRGATLLARTEELEQVVTRFELQESVPETLFTVTDTLRIARRVRDSVYADTTLRTTRTGESFTADTLANYTRVLTEYTRQVITLLKRDSTTTVTVAPLHLALHPSPNSTVLFRLRKPRIVVRYYTSEDDTRERTLTLEAGHTDYTVRSVQGAVPHDTIPAASWADDRRAVLKLDVTPVWHARRATPSGVRFTEILTASLPLRLHDYTSETGGLNLRYALTASPVLSSQDATYWLTVASAPASITDTTITLKLEAPLNALLRQGEPSSAYLHIGFDSFNRWAGGTFSPPDGASAPLPFTTLILASPEQ